MTSRVADAITRNVVSLREDAQFKDIIQVMREREFSAFPVLDTSDAVVGVVSEDDFLVKEGYRSYEPVSGFLVRHADKAKADGTDLLGVYDRPDSQIGNEIMTQLIDNEFLLDSRAFTVTVTAGGVTLRGQSTASASASASSTLSGTWMACSLSGT